MINTDFSVGFLHDDPSKLQQNVISIHTYRPNLEPSILHQ